MAKRNNNKENNKKSFLESYMTKKNSDNYRWMALVISCLVNLCVGSIYSWSVFADPLVQYLSKTTGTKIAGLSLVFTVANAVGPITMVSGGFINDKIGPRWIIFSGGILFGLGMIGSGMAKTVPMLVISYGVGVGLATGMLYGCTVSGTVKLFPDKKGLAGGLTSAAYGISSVIIPPMANALIKDFGINKALIILGTVMMVLICICAFIYSFCFDKAKLQAASMSTSEFADTTGLNWKQMLCRPYFYIMLIMLCAGAFSGLMIISNAAPLAKKIFFVSADLAAIIVSVLALFNTAGRILSGFVSDKIGVINTLRSTFVFFIIAQILLFISVSSGLILFIIGVCIVGLCFGSIMGIYPGFTAEKFGAAHNSVNYGIMFCGFSLAGYLGPLILNSIYNLTDSYKFAFPAAAGFALIGLILTFVKAKRLSR